MSQDNSIYNGLNVSNVDLEVVKIKSTLAEEKFVAGRKVKYENYVKEVLPS